MRAIPHKAITVPPRQRKNIAPGPLRELATSIASKGLLHPPVFRELTVEGKLEPIYQLVAGERRLRAMELLLKEGKTFFCDGTTFQPDGGIIPATMLNEMSQADRQEAELEENLLRVDLLWQEREAALARIHALRKEANPEQTRSDTAREIIAATGDERKTALSHTITRISRSEMLQANMHRPEVAQARSANEAYQQLLKSLEGEVASRLTQAGAAEPTLHTLHRGSAFDVLPTLPDAHFDTIIADLPYGIGADNFGSANAAHQYSDTPAEATALFTSIAQEGFRITRGQAHFYAFCDIDLYLTWRGIAAAAGWRPFRTPLIWHKGTQYGNVPWPNLGPKRTYELILFASKGDRPVQQTIADCITHIPSERNDSGHPAGKPADLYAYLLRASGTAGDQVLDPCCGGGPIFAAASRLQMRAHGIEVNPRYCDLASRLLQGTPSPAGPIADGDL